MAAHQFSSIAKPAERLDPIFAERNKVEKTVQMQCRRLDGMLDELLRAYGLSRPFLKMDTQGHDRAVCEGAGARLGEMIGLQSELAVRPQYEGAADYRAMIGYLEGKGFVPNAFFANNKGHFPLLVEMDGFPTDKGVILMAATNRPDILDQALMRPGRFDRQIGIGRPDLKGRAQIFEGHMKTIKTAPEVTSSQLAEMTPGFVGADIANVCNEAALIAARRGKKAVDIDDFNYALDKVIGGLEKKNKIISPEEKQIIAYHEAGHAICGWFLEHAHPLVKVTIVPRGLAALGYAQYLPKEQYITRKEKLLDDICMTLGGRAAESVVFNKISTGAQSDLDHITRLSYDMIVNYGLSDKIGNVSYYSMLNESYTRPFSEQTDRKSTRLNSSH